MPAGEGSNQPYFVRLPAINLDHTVFFVERHTPYNGEKEHELDELLQRQHNAPFTHADGDRPIWRLFILAHSGDDLDFFAAFIFHHAICDTRWALIFHQIFAEACTLAEAELQTSSAPPNELVVTHQTALPRSNR